MTESSSTHRWLSLVEVLLIFGLFALQGAWPVPDVNEPHYLEKAAHYWNPDWIEGDFFLDSADSHKVFYFAFGWLTLWFPLPAVAWTGRLITWLLLAWSWRRLSFALLPRAGWSILTAAVFVMLNERLHMAGEWFIGGVEAKGFAYVLMILGLEALVKNRWSCAWLLFGASAAFHAVVGGWAVVAAGFAWIFLRGNRPRLVSMLPGLMGGFLLSLPGLIPALALSRNIDAETIRQANVIYVFERLRHHLDIFQFKMEFLYRFAAMTMGYLVLSWIVNGLARKSLQQGQSQEANLSGGLPRIRILQGFVAGALSIALVGMLIDISSLYDRTFAAGLLKFYWFRLADLAVPLGVAFLLPFWIQEMLQAKLRWRRIGGFCILGLAVMVAAVHFGSYVPERMKAAAGRADRLKHVAAWQDACRFISGNTPADARFFTPRLSQTFKWYARRAEVATWKDVPQDAAALAEWWNRVQEVFTTGSLQPAFRWRDNVTEMEPEQLRKLAKKYEADYIMAPVGKSLSGWEVVYKNEGYAVYHLGATGNPSVKRDGTGETPVAPETKPSKTGAANNGAPQTEAAP